ncbi:MAG: GGDEF domain-containing protein [Hallerella porci]|uniref:GGDEF domain-containing protein n=1 Tax=Hallerella TaxID=2815788 RepID=UPI000D05B711|nr:MULTISPECIES: GGDEF domain-containing protein [Hallerella]MCI5601595.1 GGDEF domain-containing protein [Hallerella sp.]MDY3920982.1 GGDEF domain-containing protein [Hallerella porci]
MEKLILFAADFEVDQTLESILTENFEYCPCCIHANLDISKILAEKNPNVIFVTSSAALENEFQLLKSLQKEKSASSSLVMLVTPATPISEELETLKFGVQDFIVAPYCRELILNRVKQYRMRDSLHLHTDELTGLYHQNYLREVLKNLSPYDFPLGIISADCNSLKQMNESFGRDFGDEYIRLVGVLFKMILPSNSKIFRVDGDEFLALIPNADEISLQQFIRQLNAKSKLLQIRGKRVSLAFGFASIPKKEENFRPYFEQAEMQMYTDKKEKKILDS